MEFDALPIMVAANGRVSIPAAQRKALGLEKGGMVVARVENGELQLRPVRKVLSEMRADLAAYLKASGDTTDHFLADRRAEVLREDQEHDAAPRHVDAA
jgi:AbrB family looped-hinge helix DNA binding protein